MTPIWSVRAVTVVLLAGLLPLTGCTVGFFGEHVDQMPGDDDVADDDDTSDDDDDASDDDDADAYVDLTYHLDLADESFEFSEPAGLGDLLQGYLPEDDGGIFSATNISGSTVGMLFGAGVVLNPNGDPEDWVWDQTDHATSTGSGSWNNRTFLVSGVQLTMEIDGYDVWMGDSELGGTYASNGSQIEGTELEFMLDTVPFIDMIGVNFCELVTCETCPAGSPHPGANCVHVVTRNGVCPLLEGVTMTEY